MKKATVCGVGINDADYVTHKWETIRYADGKREQKMVWICPYHRAWKSMLNRCYSDKLQSKHPTYRGCTVSEDWLTFSNFKRWMEKQDFEGKQLDKDLLFESNKVYSAETCVFVTSMVNTFINDCGASRGIQPIGVDWVVRLGKFRAQCRNPYTGKREHIGLFTSADEAHKAWIKRKLELAHLIAAEQTDERVAKALIERYTNYDSNTRLNNPKG